MNIFTWLIFGLIVGVVANIIDPRPSQGGIIGAIILGVVGAMVGGFIGNLIFGVSVSGFNFPSFIIAVLGAIGVLLIGRMIAKGERE